MKVARTISEIEAELAAARRAGQTIGFVPTMGALHEGHLALVRAARSTSDILVLSIFVNPLQFGANEDLDSYPRPEEQDLRVAEEEKVDLVFLPAVAEMYPETRDTNVTIGSIGTLLEGQHRPGHFDGVATVVAKLFNIVRPHTAWFGQKDAQQVAVIRQMVRDLDFAVRIEVEPTVREPDGLALSSRNVYLSEDERERAGALWSALQRASSSLRAGGAPAEAEREMQEVLREASFDVDYARVVDPDSFGPPSDDAPVLLVIAARLGRTRLIDNLLVDRTL